MMVMTGTIDEGFVFETQNRLMQNNFAKINFDKAHDQFNNFLNERSHEKYLSIN
jgi:hypothetical protein